MTLQFKIIAVSLVVLTIGGALVVGGSGGDDSEGTVNAVKRLIGLNPLSEQDLVPLPGGVKNRTRQVGASEEIELASLENGDNGMVASTVFKLVSDSKITMPDGRVYSENTQGMYLDDYDWGAE